VNARRPTGGAQTESTKVRETPRPAVAAILSLPELRVGESRRESGNLAITEPLKEVNARLVLCRGGAASPERERWMILLLLSAPNSS
jgi:hypothetical protein